MTLIRVASARLSAPQCLTHAEADERVYVARFARSYMIRSELS